MLYPLSYRGWRRDPTDGTRQVEACLVYEWQRSPYGWAMSVIPESHADLLDKKHAIALSLCSLVGFGSLVVDSSMTGASYMSDTAASVMAALLAINVVVGPGLTWWGLKLADETHEGDEHG